MYQGLEYFGYIDRKLRYRFDPDTIARLEALHRWDWDARTITRHVQAICGADVAALERAV
jgi:virginiamycin A acetyltransferase